MHEIPLLILLSACKCVAKRTSRPHLQFIRVEKGQVIAVDGIKMFWCEVDGLDKELEIFIYPNLIKELARSGLNKKGLVTIELKNLDDDNLLVCLSYQGFEVSYPHPKDIETPNYFLVVPENKEMNICVPTYDWLQMAELQKINKILGSSLPFEIRPTGLHSATFVNFVGCNYPTAKAIIMPCVGLEGLLE